MISCHSLVFYSLVALVACKNGVRKEQMRDDLPTCATLADCSAHDGQQVHVVGVYTLHNVMPSRKLDAATAPVRIELSDGMGPYLAAYWHADAVRSPQEKASHVGKRVRVTGTFHRTMPPAPDPRMSQLGGPCIHPVVAIELSE
jgi:hypothetical protein